MLVDQSSEQILDAGRHRQLLRRARHEAGAGRTFLPQEDATPGSHPVVVLSHGLWQRRFGGDPAIVGKTLTLNRQPFIDHRRRGGRLHRNVSLRRARHLGADDDARRHAARVRLVRAAPRALPVRVRRLKPGSDRRAGGREPENDCRAARVELPDRQQGSLGRRHAAARGANQPGRRWRQPDRHRGHAVDGGRRPGPSDRLREHREPAPRACDRAAAAKSRCGWRSARARWRLDAPAPDRERAAGAPRRRLRASSSPSGRSTRFERSTSRFRPTCCSNLGLDARKC